MLQVDLFLSIGMASGLALAAPKKLKQEPSLWINKYYVTALAWTAGIFVPTTNFLILRYPAWESMFVFASVDEIPPLLVAGLSLGMVVLATLGHSLTHYWLRKGRSSLARRLCIGSLSLALLMIFVGWDGTGFRRTTYTGTGLQWREGVPIPWTDFFTSEIALVLVGLGVLFTATYGAIWIRWRREDLRSRS